MSKRKSGIAPESMIPDAGSTDQGEKKPFLEGQTSIPNLEESDKENNVIVEGNEDPGSGGNEAGDSKDSKESSPKRKSWGEVMILEKAMIPVSSDGKEKMDGFVPVSEFGLETGSTVEAEAWLKEQLDKDQLPFGDYTIIRRVKTIRAREVRQVVFEEVDE